MGEHISQRKVFTGIDVFKLISSVMVVLLHAVETSEFYASEVKFVLTRYAVPFFFISSGFFFYKGICRASNKKAYFIKYEKHLMKIFAIWCLVLYFPFTISGYIQKYPDAGFLKLAALLVRRVLVIGSGPYWYLIALMWSALFLYVCAKKRREIWILIAVVIGFILQIGFTCFRGILDQYTVIAKLFSMIEFIFSWEFNFVMYGIPFMGIGYYIAKKDCSMTTKSAALLLIISTLMRVLEYNINWIFPSDFWAYNQISVFFIPQAISAFMLAKSWNVRISTENSTICRQLSSCIYFSHAIFLYNILDPLLDTYTKLPTYASIMILPKVMVVLTACIVLFIIIKRINNKHLNILING